MAKFKFELNRAGVRDQLLKSDAMMSMCEQLANEACQRCGDGYSVSTYVGKNRINAAVHAETDKAKKDNLKNNTLLKSLKGG